MISGIFYIKNKITNEYYIGQSVNIDRIRKEYYNKLESNSHRNDNLQESYNRYGGDAFEFKKLCAGDCENY